MAQITIDSAAVRAIRSDDIEALLHRMIDAELSKNEEDIDTGFVDECINALIEIEQDKDKGFSVLIPLVSAGDYLNRITGKNNWNTLSRAARIALLAAVFTTSTIAVNAAVEGVTGVNLIKEAGVYLQNAFYNNTPKSDEGTVIKEKTPIESTIEEISLPQPVFTGTEEGYVEDIDDDDEKPQPTGTEEGYGGDIDDGDDEPQQEDKPSEEHITPDYIPTSNPPANKNPVFTHIEADLTDFKHDYIYGEELTYDGLSVYAVFSDGSTQALSLEECTVTQSVDMHKTADYTLRIIYKNSVLEIRITVRPDEETRGSEIRSNEEFDYLLTDKGAYITAYRGAQPSLYLAETDGNAVYAIGASVFEGSEVETVELPNAQKLFENAFKDCKQLNYCSTPNAEYIGNSAFEGCTSLQNADAENATLYLGKNAYAGSGITDITLPEGIEAVPANLCRECESLVSVNLNGASIIGGSAFSDCTALESVIGTKNIRAVGDTAFYGDEKADFETVPSGLQSVGTSGFAYCKKIKFGVLPGALAEIGDYAFMYCTGVTGVTLAEDIKIIPQGAFWGTRIKSVTLPEGLERIEAAAFMSTMLGKVTIPESVEYIGARAFQTASALTVTFEGSPEIENAAFFKSSRLKFYAYENSSAVDYAVENEIAYEIMERSEGNEAH